MRMIEILSDALETIGSEDRWCRKATALSGHGAEVPPRSSDASYWSMGGAIVLATRSDIQDGKRIIDILQRMSKQPVEEFNDSHTHEEVLNLMMEAISLIGGEDGGNVGEEDNASKEDPLPKQKGTS